MSDVRLFGKDAHVSDFAPFDRFYLQMWTEDLKYHFPFVDVRRNSHPYQVFYYIWKLSYLFGVKYCDHSIAFESLVSEPELETRKLFRVTGAKPADPASLRAIVSAPPLGKWREYAEATWFEDYEARCEEVLVDFLRTGAGPGIDKPIDIDPVALRLGDRTDVS
jgi:hypothetical protein